VTSIDRPSSPHAPGPPRTPAHPLHARLVVPIAVAGVAMLLAVAPRYGYHRDELYFRLLGERPALGYFDTPPFTPAVARLSTALFGDNLVALRVFPALCFGVLIVLAALVAREAGGGRGAQALAAAGTATSVLPLVMGHMLLTLTPDTVLWVAALLFVMRALLRGDGRWWLAVGAVMGAATYNRQLIVLVVLGVGAGILLAGPRSVLRDRRLWLGALLAVVIAAPNLFYQATHDWPQAQMSQALALDEGAGNRADFLPMQILLLGPPLAVICAAGWWRLWRDAALRCLAIAYPVACALVLYAGGRPDYTGGLLILLYAVGCVPAAAWLTTVPRRVVLIGAVAVNGVLSIIVALPVIPVSALAETPVPEVNEASRESVGWPELAAAVGGVVAGLSPADRSGAIILTQNYGEAGALALHSARYALPPIYSGHNELSFWGPPPDSATVAVVLTDAPRRFATLFAECAEKARVDNGVGVRNEEQNLPILVCRSPVSPWHTLWPRLRHYS
jgi:4-amino-4-deoxy-L-arabinose transferase-like glycosyltransferase